MLVDAIVGGIVASTMFVFLLSILLIVAADADIIKTVTTTHPTGLLFDAKLIQISEAPYHVSIVKQNQARCAGVILSADHVLTAAHCGRWGNIEVRTGSSYRSTNGSLHKIQSHVKIEHASYLESQNMYLNWDESRYALLTNDIAILKLAEPIKFDDSRQPIGLFDENEDVGVGVDAVVTGWSKVNGSEHLSTRVVQTLDTSLCNLAYKDMGGVPAGQICAAYPGAAGKSGCVGISGGPLVVNGRLAGILSWGNGCVKPHYPGVYTEIAYYRRWIEQMMEEKGGNSR